MMLDVTIKHLFLEKKLLAIQTIGLTCLLFNSVQKHLCGTVKKKLHLTLN